MLPEIWEPGAVAVFVDAAIMESSDALGFHHLHPKDRFWELLELGGITPGQIIDKKERKALAEGHARGNLSDPIRAMFVMKKTSQLTRLGIGITDLNRRVVAPNDKHKESRPTSEDIRTFLEKVERLKPRVLGFLLDTDVFGELFRGVFPEISDTLGLEPFRMHDAEVWLLGSTTKVLRGESLAAQEDAFFSLGERLSAFRGDAPPA